MNRLLKFKSVNNASLDNQGITPAWKIYMCERDLFLSFCYLEKQYEMVIYIGLCEFRIHALFIRRSFGFA